MNRSRHRRRLFRNIIRDTQTQHRWTMSNTTCTPTRSTSRRCRDNRWPRRTRRRRDHPHFLIGRIPSLTPSSSTRTSARARARLFDVFIIRPHIMPFPIATIFPLAGRRLGSFLSGNFFRRKEPTARPSRPAHGMLVTRLMEVWLTVQQKEGRLLVSF